MESLNQHLLGYVVWITLVWTVCMTVQIRGFNSSKSRLNRLESPILPIELSVNSTQFDAVLDRGDREQNARVIRVNTYMDFLFIFLYSSIFWMLASLAAGPLMYWTRSAVLSTALLDVAENVAILRQVHRVLAGTGGNVSAPYYPSIVKWALFGLVLCLLGVTLCRSSFPAHHVWIGILVLVAGLTCLVGLVHHRLINASVLLLFPALIGVGIQAFLK